MTYEVNIKGPCISCGAEDYGLSTSGPRVCPSCACYPAKERIKQMREEIRVLKKTLKEALDKLRIIVYEYEKAADNDI